MDSDQIGGLVAILIFYVLPVIMGLIAIIYARALVRSQMRFLSRSSTEHLEPSDAAIAIYRLIGAILIALPLVIILITLVAYWNQPSWSR